MKRYRVYYNRSVDWPQMWSIDEGAQTSEWNVQHFVADGCLVRDRSLAPPARSLEGAASIFPVAWLEIEAADCRMVDGVAVFIPCTR